MIDNNTTVRIVMLGRGEGSEMGDGRRARGDLTRAAIMGIAVDVASLHGLDGLSIGGLATRASLSKGGVVALFGTKEQLQLATVAAASEIFRDRVVARGLAERKGLARVRALSEAWIDYSEQRVFAGGCFFAAVSAESRSRQDPVRDAIADAVSAWTAYLTANAADAIERGELPVERDAEQLAFELTSILYGANFESLLYDSPAPYARARRAVDALLSPDHRTRPADGPTKKESGIA